MPIYLLTYYLLLFFAAILTLPPARYDKSLYFITALLLCSLVEELIHASVKTYLVYHIYVPIYYDLFMAYFLANIPLKKIRFALIFTMVAFPIVSLWLSYPFTMPPDKEPGFQINMGGILMIVWCLIGLYYLNVEDETPLYKRPLIWICISTIIFYSSILIVLGISNYVSKDLMDHYLRPVRIGLVLFYYLLMTIGMLCSLSPRKSLAPSS
jgi:hypothetical protein